jgi:hypothetical protein
MRTGDTEHTDCSISRWVSLRVGGKVQSVFRNPHSTRPSIVSCFEAKEQIKQRFRDNRMIGSLKLYLIWESVGLFKRRVARVA